MPEYKNSNAVSLHSFGVGDIVRLVGVIKVIKHHKTKMGNMMAFCTVTDEKGITEVIVFPDAYQKYHEHLNQKEEKILEIEVLGKEFSNKLSVKKILPIKK